MILICSNCRLSSANGISVLILKCALKVYERCHACTRAHMQPHGKGFVEYATTAPHFWFAAEQQARSQNKTISRVSACVERLCKHGCRRIFAVRTKPFEDRIFRFMYIILFHIGFWGCFFASKYFGFIPTFTQKRCSNSDKLIRGQHTRHAHITPLSKLHTHTLTYTHTQTTKCLHRCANKCAVCT